jgi:hypothetical protein
MSENEKRFTPMQRCPHCGVETPMEIVSTHTRVKRRVDEHDGSQSNQSAAIYELLSCPVCEEVTLRSRNEKVPLLSTDHNLQSHHPESVKRPDLYKPTYATLNTFRKIDPVAYRVMIGHLVTIRECNRMKRI